MTEPSQTMLGGADWLTLALFAAMVFCFVAFLVGVTLLYLGAFDKDDKSLEELSFPEGWNYKNVTPEDPPLLLDCPNYE